MPRPVRCRRIGQMPAFRSFSPDDAPDAEVIRLTLDEYETLRLMDAEGLNQEACAAQMNVARTTVTAIYESARHKIATALVRGKRLQITGGCCEFAPVPPPEHLIMKGSQNMRIAIPYEQGEIFQHFGHTEQFKLYDVENGTIIREQIVNTNGSGHGALAGFLQAAQADARPDLRRDRRRCSDGAGGSRDQAVCRCDRQRGCRGEGIGRRQSGI